MQHIYDMIPNGWDIVYRSNGTPVIDKVTRIETFDPMIPNHAYHVRKPVRRCGNFLIMKIDDDRPEYER